MSWCVVLRPPARPVPTLLTAGSAGEPFAVLTSLSLSLSVSCLSVSLSSSSSLTASFFLLSVVVSPPLTPPRPHPHVWPALSPTATPGCPSGPAASWYVQWHPPGRRQSGRRGGAGGGAGRPAGGEAGSGAATRRGRLEKRRGCPQRAGQRWQGGGERPLADGAEPPGRREAQLVQVSDGPTAAGAVSSGLPSHPPPPASVDSGTPGMPAAAPRGAVLGPWLIPSLHKTPIILATRHDQLSHAPCISASGCHPHRFLFASDQIISFSAPRAASFQSLGHPILFDWLPHLDLHGHQATTVSHWTIHPWGAGPASAYFLLLICHRAFPLATSTKL